MTRKMGLMGAAPHRRDRHALACAAVALACAAGAAGADRLTAAAVWQPGGAFMKSVHERCDARMASGFDACFIEAMSREGAPAAAVDFAKRMVARPNGLVATMRSFRRTGGAVDVAYVQYPFRANENDACLLVNGTPDIVDVDDPKGIEPAAWSAHAAFQTLQKRYSNISVWPGDRTGTAYPRVTAAPGASGGQRFVFSFTFRDGCHACAVVGSGEMAFDFDTAGRRISQTVVTVIPKP